MLVAARARASSANPSFEEVAMKDDVCSVQVDFGSGPCGSECMFTLLEEAARRTRAAGAAENPAAAAEGLIDRTAGRGAQAYTSLTEVGMDEGWDTGGE